MNYMQRVRIYLEAGHPNHSDAGLQCLPTFWKRACLNRSARFRKDALRGYCSDTLKFVAQQLDPVIRETVSCDSPGRLSYILGSDSWSEFTSAAGREIDEPSKIVAWLEYAEQCSSIPVQLICLTCFFVAPLSPDKRQAHDDVRAGILLATLLASLGYYTNGIRSLERVLDLTSESYESSYRFGNDLTSIRSAVSDDELIAAAVSSLARLMIDNVQPSDATSTVLGFLNLHRRFDKTSSPQDVSDAAAALPRISATSIASTVLLAAEALRLGGAPHIAADLLGVVIGICDDDLARIRSTRERDAPIPNMEWVRSCLAAKFRFPPRFPSNTAGQVATGIGINGLFRLKQFQTYISRPRPLDLKDVNPTVRATFHCAYVTALKDSGRFEESVAVWQMTTDFLNACSAEDFNAIAHVRERAASLPTESRAQFLILGAELLGYITGANSQRLVSIWAALDLAVDPFEAGIAESELARVLPSLNDPMLVRCSRMIYDALIADQRYADARVALSLCCQHLAVRGLAPGASRHRQVPRWLKIQCSYLDAMRLLSEGRHSDVITQILSSLNLPFIRTESSGVLFRRLADCRILRELGLNEFVPILRLLAEAFAAQSEFNNAIAVLESAIASRFIQPADDALSLVAISREHGVDGVARLLARLVPDSVRASTLIPILLGICEYTSRAEFGDNAAIDILLATCGQSRNDLDSDEFLFLPDEGSPFWKAAMDFDGSAILDTVQIFARLLGNSGKQRVASRLLVQQLQDLVNDDDVQHVSIAELIFDKVLASHAPAKRIEYAIDWLSVTSPVDDATSSVCGRLISYCRDIGSEQLKSYPNRIAFWRQMKNVRQAVLNAAMGYYKHLEATHQSLRSAEFGVALTAWMEQIENRILLEETLLRGETRKLQGESALRSSHTTDWAMDAPWRQNDVQLEFSKWYGEVRSGTRDINRPSDKQVALSCLGRVEAEEAANCGFGGDISFEATTVDQPQGALLPRPAAISTAPLVPVGAVWVRSLFAADGTLHWWALRRSSTNCNNELIVAGQSEQPHARVRLEVANMLFDAEVEAIWEIASGKWDQPRYKSSAKFGRHLATSWSKVSSEALDPAEEFAEIETMLSDLRRRLPACAALGTRFLKTIHPQTSNQPQSDLLARSWKILTDLLTAQVPEDAADRTGIGNIASWKDSRLNRACTRHRSAVARDFNLSPLFRDNDEKVDFARTNFIFTTEGPLLAAPLSYIPIDGKPLFYSVRSVSTAISLSLNALAEVPQSNAPPDASTGGGILSAIWEQPALRSPTHGLAYLHAGLCDVSQEARLRSRESPEVSVASERWRVVSLTDDPQLTPAFLDQTLRSRKYDIVIVGGHGHFSKAGVALADNSETDDTKQTAEGVRTETHQQLWTGEGSFDGTELVVLCSCAVGRLQQESSTDVAGLYTRISAHGGRSVVAARWPIDSLHAAFFTIEFIRRYIRLRDTVGAGYPFLRARALNGARKASFRKLERQKPAPEHHLISAFDLYGSP